MSWYHWPIVIVPVAFVVWMAIYSHRYARSVADYLVAGRVAGRYVLSAAGLMDGLAVISLIVEGEVNEINSLSGNLGKIANVMTKAVITKMT